MSSEAAGAGAGSNAVKGTNVQVAVRCRPLNGEEKKTGQPCVIACDQESKSIRVNYGPVGKKIQKAFNFDKVFGMYSTQEEVFDQIVRPIVDEALAGFNCTIFAYGQTGTGKTHTMEGDIHSEENAGIVPRSVKWILEQLEASGAEFTIRVSFLELYNEELQDLLAKPSDDKKLKLCEDVKKGVVCQNLEEITVLNVADIFEILQRGIQQRITAETLCNKNSSRSHSIFTLKIMIKECNVEGEEVVRHGQLNLVDLAGSECVGRSGAKDGRAREAGSINQSLLTLGRVITALVDHHGHIPYRDSKLTRLLQESLGGKAKTCIIATLSPSQLAVEESMSTLDYAHRAKNIKNQPTVNQKSTKKVVLKEYCAEIESLKAQLQITREKNGVYVDPAEYYAMEQRLQTQENQIAECEGALRSKTEEAKTLRAEREGIIAELEQTQTTLQHTVQELQVVSECFETTKHVLQETETELKASNAVVTEQVFTEQTLHAQGTSIQRELTHRREDVDGLLAKIDRHAASESRRLQATAQMINRLNTTRTDLNKRTHIFAQQSEATADYLKSGVADMLGKSRSTCNQLSVAIDSALQTLIGDANIAKDNMTTSCTHLENHLHSTETNITDTLVGIKAQLSNWLGEVDRAMQTAQQFVVTQQQQLEALTVSIAEKSIEYVTQCDEIMKAQEAQSMSFLMENRELRAQIVSCVDRFEAEHQAQLAASSEAVKTKAVEIELAMKSMLHDFVSSTTSSLGNSIEQTKSYCTSVKHVAESGLSHAENRTIAAQSAAKTQSQGLKAQVIASADAHKAQVEGIKQTRSQAEQTLRSISGSVGEKKEFLDSTVDSLKTCVHADIENAVSVVAQTAETANTILVDVHNATTRMTASTTDSIKTLTQFLDTQGDKINKDLGTHFTTLSQHLSSTHDHTEAMVGAVVEFGAETQESRLQPTGKTPSKTAPFKALDTLVRTREHEVIREESRAGLFSAPVASSASVSDLTLELMETDESSNSTSSSTAEPSPSSPATPASEEATTSSASASVDSENGDPNQSKPTSIPAFGKKTSSASAAASTSGKAAGTKRELETEPTAVKRSTRQTARVV